MEKNTEKGEINGFNPYDLNEVAKNRKRLKRRKIRPLTDNPYSVSRD